MNSASIIEATILLSGGIFAILLGYGIINPFAASARTAGLIKHMKWLGPLVIVLGLGMLLQGQGRPQITAQEIVSGMKQHMTLPITVDDQTRLDSVEATEHRITYRLTITKPMPSTSEREQLISMLRRQIADNACGNPSYKKILKLGITLEMMYRMPDGVSLPAIIMSPSDCGF
jgi:hypothetical protein